MGLPPKTDGQGRTHEKIFIPRGILIPTIAPDGAILNIRIRRHKEDLKPLPSGKAPPKYLELEGSYIAPMLLRAHGPADLAAYFVTEAELDAILIHFATGGIVGGLAVRTNRGKRDRRAHERLRHAVKICIALDYDEPGAAGVPWWEQTYPQAVRWPTPDGKDPGDAFRLGVDIREWVAAALPPTIKLPPLSHVEDTDSREATLSYPKVNGEDYLQNGQMDTFVAGQKNIGERGEKGGWDGKKENVSEMHTSADVARAGSPAGFTDNEIRILRSAVPKECADALSSLYPPEVLRAYLLWRDVPVSFYSEHDAIGNCTGFGWKIDYSWRAKNVEKFEAFFDYQDRCPVLSQWLSDHPDKEISWQNLLDFWRK